MIFFTKNPNLIKINKFFFFFFVGGGGGVREGETRVCEFSFTKNANLI